MSEFLGGNPTVSAIVFSLYKCNCLLTAKTFYIILAQFLCVFLSYLLDFDHVSHYYRVGYVNAMEYWVIVYSRIIFTVCGILCKSDIGLL